MNGRIGSYLKYLFITVDDDVCYNEDDDFTADCFPLLPRVGTSTSERGTCNGLLAENDFKVGCIGECLFYFKDFKSVYLLCSSKKVVRSYVKVFKRVYFG